MTRRLPTNSDPRRRVLVIDDEPVIHELVADIMDDYEIISAGTGAEAKLVVTSGRAYDVALVDKNLPDVSGLDLVPWLREARPDAEVVIITAYPSMDSALEAMSLGATDYLIKPMRDINELRLRVGNACERVRQRRAERKLVEALEQSELSYRELYESSPDAVLVIDAVTRTIEDANSAAERLYGLPRARLLGMNAASLTSQATPPIVANGLVRRREQRADGTLVSVEVTTSTLHRDERACVVEVIRDVSERERADAERAELEKRLARTTRFEELGRLAAGIAHDVNNLLTVVRTNAELAAEAIGTGHIALEDLGQIEAAVTSAADLTRRLLAFSGRQLVRPKVLDVNTLVAGIGKMLARTFEARARLVIDACPTPAMTKIDPSQLEQVITNLAVNARDALPDGGTITIRTRVRPDEPRVVLEVSDTGAGIPADILPDIFEPFFTTKGSGGTGLGLATVREIVVRNGGTVDVRSSTGVGTTFEICLPWTDDAIAEASGRVRAPVHAGRGEAVLVVEDDRGVRGDTPAPRRCRLRGPGRQHRRGRARDACRRRHAARHHRHRSPRHVRNRSRASDRVPPGRPDLGPRRRCQATREPAVPAQALLGRRPPALRPRRARWGWLMTVGRKLVTIVAIVGLVPLAVSAVTALGTYEQELGREVAEGHRRTADHGARSVVATVESVEHAVRGLAGTIPWTTLTEAERQGALVLVYEQDSDLALVALRDRAGTNLGSIHATAASTHPVIATALAGELAKQNGAHTPGWTVGSPIVDPLVGPLVPMTLELTTPEASGWTLTLGLSLRRVCRELADASPTSVSTRLEGPDGLRLCGPAAASGTMVARKPALAGWYVTAEQGRDDAFASLYRLRRQWLFIIAVAAAAAIGAGLVLTLAIRRPIRGLVAASKALARGELGHRVGSSSNDELGALGRSFDHMAGELEKKEAEIRAWNAELQERVDARTAELKAAQEQLLQSRKLGAIATLGAGIAHEINNPLMGVLGTTQVLLARRDSLDAKTATRLQTIEREALRIRDIIENMQGLAQDTMRDAIRVDLATIVDSVAKSRAPQLAGASVQVVRAIDGDVPDVMGNAGQLEHAISHLVDNSIRAMTPAGGTLRLTVRSIEGELVAVDVEDSGRGIAPELMDRIFEPFFTTKENWRGLGLALAHRIVEVHKGRISASSKGGRGTTMTITLPAARRGAHLT